MDIKIFLHFQGFSFSNKIDFEKFEEMIEKRIPYFCFLFFEKIRTTKEKENCIIFKCNELKHERKFKFQSIILKKVENGFRAYFNFDEDRERFRYFLEDFLNECKMILKLKSLKK